MIRGRIESIRVARRIRAAVNIDKGFIDIKACLRIADELENFGNYRRVERSVGGNQKGQKSYADGKLKVAKVSGADLVQILSLKSLGEGVLIETLLRNSEKTLTIEEIAKILNASDHNSRNAIYDLRYHFKKLGFGPVISNRRGEGYYISERASREIHEFIESWKRCFLLDVPQVT